MKKSNLTLFLPFPSISPPAVSIYSTLPPSLWPHLYSLPRLPFRERMKLPFMTDQCEQMLKICNEFVRLQVSYDEYLCMKVLLLLSTGNGTHFSLEKSQQCFSYLCNCNYFGITQNVNQFSIVITVLHCHSLFISVK